MVYGCGRARAGIDRSKVVAGSVDLRIVRRPRILERDRRDCAGRALRHAQTSKHA
jgi:hypothetical protein